MSTSITFPEDLEALGDEPVRTLRELLGSARWALALPLAERPTPIGEYDVRAAEQRLARWKSTGAFAKDPSLWNERLASAGLDEDALRAVVGQTGEQVAATLRRPAFVDMLEAAYGDERMPPFPWPAKADLSRCRFLPLLEPLVWHVCSRLELAARAIAATHPDAPFTPDIARTLTSHLPDHFAALLNRTLVVEMHVLKLEERLHGETSEERFANFIEHVRDPRNALEILERYPVLAQQAVQRLELWLNACTELLDRVAGDVREIATHFANGNVIGTLRDVHGAISDFHRGGRAVLILVFDSGFELVYKPKSLALEEAFQHLLGWLNDRGFAPQFRRTAVLDRGEYGWMEMVYTHPCADEAALQRFFERQGGYLALLYALDGTDFHHENLLASGEHPILIDLETLFQPWLTTRDLHDVENAPGAPLRATVLRTNLLPERWYGDKNNPGVDLSGLAAVEGQLTPRPMLAATDAGLDTMRMERRRMRIPVGDNRPHIDGRDVAREELVAPLVTGFRRMYALLAEHREAFIAELAAFAHCETRILFRTTMSYGTVMLESLHPHALGNALERDRLFDTLWTSVIRRPYLRALARAEAEDLHRGDIPLFLTRPNSRDAMHWRGETYANFFEQSGLERAMQRIRELSPRDCERQIAVIRDTFDAMRISSGAFGRPSYSLVARAKRPDDDELLSLACTAADRIVERAFENESQAHWLTLDYRDPDGWQLVPAHPDLYLGLSGIAFFLAHLGAATANARYSEVARKALFAQKQQLIADPNAIRGIGGFNGWGGVIYTLAHVGRLWNDDALLDEAESYARDLASRIDEDEMLDLIAGSAGCALSLLALAKVRPSRWLDDRLRACGDRLLEKAERQTVGCGWRMPLAGDRVLAGISHGAAGIALALLRIADHLGDARYRFAAREGLAFERSLFDVFEQNWPDLRAGAAEGDKTNFMLAWCHGAPGIGLARIATLPSLDDDDVRREIDVAVRSTLAGGFGENHSLCHGDLGNVELLFEAARATGDRVLEERARRISGGIVDHITHEGWLSGLPGNIETPGLMSGLSGIGYGLARIARPEIFPRLLTLES